MSKNQKMCVMVAIFSGVMLFISGTSFKKNYRGRYFQGTWFTGTNSQIVPNPNYDPNNPYIGSTLQHPTMYKDEKVTNYIGMFCAGLLAVSGAGYFILGNEENKS